MSKAYGKIGKVIKNMYSHKEQNKVHNEISVRLLKLTFPIDGRSIKLVKRTDIKTENLSSLLREA